MPQAFDYPKFHSFCVAATIDKMFLFLANVIGEYFNKLIIRTYLIKC